MRVQPESGRYHRCPGIQHNSMALSVILFLYNSSTNGIHYQKVMIPLFVFLTRYIAPPAHGRTSLDLVTDSYSSNHQLAMNNVCHLLG